MTKKQVILITGGSMVIMSLGLAFYWYGWKLVVVLFLALWGSNLENVTKDDLPRT